MAVVLLALAGGLWAVTRIDVPAPPPVPAAAKPSEIPTPAPLNVTVDPPSVPAGTDTVRVSASCPPPHAEATAVSDAFAVSFTLDEPIPSGGLSGEAELEKRIVPGTYTVFAKCGAGEAIGRADLVVTKGEPAPRPSGPRRIATTWITLGEPSPETMRQELDNAKVNGVQDPVVFQVKVTHEMRVPADDPDVAALRQGAAAYEPIEFAEERLGAIEATSLNSYSALQFGVPTVRVERGSREAVVTLTGTASGITEIGDRSYVGIEFSPPQSVDVRPLTAHEIVISATGWSVAGVRGPPPLGQDAHYLRLRGDATVRAAFTRDGRIGAVAAFLAGDEQIGAHIDGSDPWDREEEGQDAVFLRQGGEAVVVVFSWAGVLVVLYSLIRALGGPWWRRPRNWLLVALVVTAYPMISDVRGGFGVGVGLVLLMAALPALALWSAVRAVDGAGRAPVVIGFAAAGLAGAAVTAWTLGRLFGEPTALWGMVAAAATVGAAAFARWRRWLPGVVLVTLASGALLAGRALSMGVFPDVLLWGVLLALSWSVLSLAWTTEAAHRWTPRTVIFSAVAVPVTLGVLIYAMFPDLRLTWNRFLAEPYFAAPEGLMLYVLPVLALAMLVVRVRRAGQTPDGLTEATAFHTAVLFVLLPRAQAADNPPFLGIVLLLAWAGISWLVPAAGGHVVRAPVTADEHRLLVRDMIRRRSVRAALTDLLRRRDAGEEFEEQRAALERSADERSGPVDSDLALGTLAGRTPWRNALAALGVGTLLSLPFSAVRIAQSVSAGQTALNQLVIALLAVLSLPMLSMVFGYFYPRVRGTNPINKSLAFLVAALLIELPAYGQTLLAAAGGLSTVEEALIGVLVAVGNIAVVSIGLGLWWEWRLMSLAGEPWSRVRNIRTLRALAAPLAAVSIAIATTTATALVNNVIAPLPSAPATESPAATPNP